MSFSHYRVSIRSALLLLVLMLCPKDGWADGWKVQLQGVKALGMSYAGRGIYPDDASTAWFNPAGMTRLKRRATVTTAAPHVSFHLDYRDAGSTSLLGQPLTGSSTRDGGMPAWVPHLYAVLKLSDRWWIGGGLNGPYGLANDYGEQWVGRYHATKSELRVANVSPVVAFRINDIVSIGAGFDAQYSTATLANMLDFGSIGAAFGLPLRPQGHDGRIEFTGTDWAFGYDLSVAVTPSERTRLGVSYRSEIVHTLAGPVEFTVPPEARLLTLGGTQFTSADGSAVLPMPHELAASASYDVGRGLVVVGDLTWTDWSRFRQLELTLANPAQAAIVQDASFEDSIRGAAGLVYQLTERWEIRGGGLYETTPVPDRTRTPRLPEVNNAGWSVGGSWHPQPWVDLDVSYSHLIPHDAPIRLSAPAAGTLSGDVRWRLQILAVGATFRF